MNTTVKKCILTDEELTQENDSKAHIIPSALGGNIKPKGVISNKANGVLNEKFDAPLIEALHPFMALLGAVPDRGNVQPTQMRAEDGKDYLVKYGENLIPTRPEFNRTETDSGEVKYEIKARTRKEAKTLLGKVKKEFPDTDISEISNNLDFEETPLDGMLSQRLNLGPNVFFPAAFIMASLYSASNGLNAHPRLVEFVNGFNDATLSDDEHMLANTATIPPDTFYWVPPENWFSIDCEISHIIVMFSDHERKLTLFYVELFNLPGVAVILPYEGESEQLFSHGIDVITGNTVKITVDKDYLKSKNWETTHPWEKGKLDDFFALARQKVGKLIKYSQDRSHRLEIDKKIEEKFGDLGDKLLSVEEKKGIFEIIVDSHLNKILRGLNGGKAP